MIGPGHDATVSSFISSSSIAAAVTAAGMATVTVAITTTRSTTSRGMRAATPEASPVVVLTTALLLGLIGLVAGYFPARRASLLDPVVALKLS